MRIDTEMVEILINLLRQEKFDEVLFNKFSKLKQVDDLIIHDKSLNRNTTIQDLKESLINTLNGSQVNTECYLFNKARNDMDKLEKIVKYFKDNEKKMENNIHKRIERYVPKECLQDCIYYLYTGGYDYGFNEKTGEIYINICNMIDYFDELEDVLVHEFYHSRKHPVDANEFFIFDFSKDEYLKNTFNYIIEEGIATLVQLEYEKKRDNATFITKEDFDKKYKYMDFLDDCIKDIYYSNKSPEESMNIFFNFNGFKNLYVVGYWIAQVLYKHGGRKSLNYWTIDHNHKICLKIFIEETRKEKIRSGFSREIEDYLLEYCS